MIQVVNFVFICTLHRRLHHGVISQATKQVFVKQTRYKLKTLL